MLLYHVTTTQSLPAIMRDGLLPSKSRRKTEAVWLAPPSRLPWALRHAYANGAQDPSQIVVIPVRIPRSWLKRFKGHLWMCFEVIPPERFGVIKGWSPISLVL